MVKAIPLSTVKTTKLTQLNARAKTDGYRTLSSRGIIAKQQYKLKKRWPER